MLDASRLRLAMPSFFNWPPFKLIAIDTDTNKPVDPNVGRKTYVTYYDIKKSKNGSKSFVAHRSDVTKRGEEVDLSLLHLTPSIDR